jgi:hypothetical protein
VAHETVVLGHELPPTRVAELDGLAVESTMSVKRTVARTRSGAAVVVAAASHDSRRKLSISVR